MELNTKNPSLPLNSSGNTSGSKMPATPEMVEKTLKALTDVAAIVDLLALNTELEAVRLGGKGKEFSAVAGDIRALLNRAAKTTFELKDKVSQ